MKISPRRIIIGLCIAIAALGVIWMARVYIFMAILALPANDRDNTDPGKRVEMVRLATEWGRLAPFPATARHFAIHTEGNMFTRTFRGSFVDTTEVISKWLYDSRGISEGKSEIQPDKSTEYVLVTGGSASYAEVIVSPDGTHVSFRVSWS